MDMMPPRQLILLEIDSLFEAFDEQLAFSKQHNGPIPIIELDMMKQTVRNLYQQLHDLEKYQERKLPIHENKGTQITTIKEAITVEGATLKEPFAKQEELEEIISEIPLIETPDDFYEIKNDELLFHEIAKTISEERTAMLNTEMIENASKAEYEENTEVNLMNNVTIIESEIETTVTFKKPEEVIVVKEEVKITKTLFDDYTPTIAEKFHHEESVYDRMSKTKTDVSIAEKMQTKSVEDLQKSIGINERFLFLNELFNGNPQHYTEAITRLNSFTNLQDAKAFLNENLSVKYAWNKQSTAYTELLKLIERRLSIA
jgi:hypothetical protein